MATLIAQQSLNLLSPSYFPGTSSALVMVSNEATLLLREPDGTVAGLDGTFVLDEDTREILSGTITGILESQPPGGTIYTLTGISLDYDAYELLRFTGEGSAVLNLLLAGNDGITGSPGADTLVGLDGADTISGGDGDDDVNGNTGNDSVEGGAGRDFVRGGQSSDRVIGGTGDDWHLNGNIGNDTVLGDSGNDILFGGQDQDLLYGDLGQSSVVKGHDLIDGNLGNDTIFGEGGNDTMTGGGGADRFAIRSGEDVDLIKDFNPGQGDRIAIQPNINGTGVDTFAELQPRMTAQGNDTVIDLGGGNLLIVQGVAPSAITAGNVDFFLNAPGLGAAAASNPIDFAF